MTELATEQKILANSFHFHALLKSAHAAWAQRKPDIAAGLAQHAAHFAWFNGIGQMVSRELEDLMLEIAEMIETVLSNVENEQVIADVRARVNAKMKEYPLFAY